MERSSFTILLGMLLLVSFAAGCSDSEVNGNNTFDDTATAASNKSIRTEGAAPEAAETESEPSDPNIRKLQVEIRGTCVVSKTEGNYKSISSPVSGVSISIYSSNWWGVDHEAALSELIETEGPLPAIHAEGEFTSSESGAFDLKTEVVLRGDNFPEIGMPTLGVTAFIFVVFRKGGLSSYKQLRVGESERQYELGEIVLQEPGTLSGILVDCDGEPVANAEFQAEAKYFPDLPGIGPVTSTTDGSGAFTVLLPGTVGFWHIRVPGLIRAEDYKYAGRWRGKNHVYVSAGESLTLEPLAFGQPGRFLLVGIDSIDNTPVKELTGHLMGRHFTSLDIIDGRVEMDLPAGYFKLSLYRAGKIVVENKRIEIVANQTNTFNLKIDRRLLFKLTLKDEDGKPVNTSESNYASVLIRNLSVPGKTEMQLSEDGTFSGELLPSKGYSLEVYVEGYVRYGKKIEVSHLNNSFIAVLKKGSKVIVDVNDSGRRSRGSLDFLAMIRKGSQAETILKEKGEQFFLDLYMDKGESPDGLELLRGYTAFEDEVIVALGKYVALGRRYNATKIERLEVSVLEGEICLLEYK